MDIAFVIINAITVAAIYGLIAIAGIRSTWSSLGLVHLAYGFIFSFAGYAAWLASTPDVQEPVSDRRHWYRGRSDCRKSSSACSSSFPSMTSPPSPHEA